VFVGDPCYTITGDASHHISTWSEWCDRSPLDSGDHGVSEPAGKGLGLTLPTLHGDGTYPVYAEVHGGRITSITVDFDPQEAEMLEF
jgi:hypothetical protein